MDVALLRIRGCVVVAMGLMLGACGGEEGETVVADSGANGPPPMSGAPPANRAPTIAGTPGTAVMQGTAYTFMPNGNDADGDTLHYSIANAPAWASFDVATGRLWGNPGPEHVGATDGIVISVSDGELSASLAEFALAVQAVATGVATLSWVPPTDNTDGSPLTNLAGYKIYWGSSAGSYPNSVTLNTPGITRYVVTDLVPGTWFFVATALNTSGVESTFSSPASQIVQ